MKIVRCLSDVGHWLVCHIVAAVLKVVSKLPIWA